MLLGSIYNKPVNANVVEVKTIVYHSSYLPFVDPNIDDNSRDIAVLALTQPLTFTGKTLHKENQVPQAMTFVHFHCISMGLVNEWHGGENGNSWLLHLQTADFA